MATARVLAIGALLLALVLGGCGMTARPAGPAPAARGVWRAVADGPLSARREVAGVWLADRFVLVGGWTDPPCPPAAACSAPDEPARRDGAAYDPATDRWTSIVDAPVPVSSWGNAVVVGQLLYLLTGNAERDDSPAAFLSYDPARDRWQSLPLPDGGALHLLAAGDRVVAVSGSDERGRATDHAFDPATGRWSELPQDPLGPSYGRQMLWLGDRLLLEASDLASDRQGEPPRWAALDQDLRRWTELPPTDLAGGYPEAAGGRVVYAFSNLDEDTPVGRAGPYPPYGALVDPDAGRWDMLSDPPDGPGLGGYQFTAGGSALVGGHLVDPATGTWTEIPTPPWGRQDHRAPVAGDGTVLVWGGDEDLENQADGYLLRL